MQPYSLAGNTRAGDLDSEELDRSTKKARKSICGLFNVSKTGLSGDLCNEFFDRGSYLFHFDQPVVGFVPVT